MYIAAILTLYLMFHTYKPKKEKKLKNEAQELNGNAGSSSSDLKRASQTASFLSSSPVLRDNLREINVGDFTGMSVKDTYTSNHEIFQSLQNDSFQFPKIIKPPSIELFWEAVANPCQASPKVSATKYLKIYKELKAKSRKKDMLLTRKLSV